MGLDNMDPVQILEDENRILREELSRLQSNTIDTMHRRPMAAIAGGGFRGPQKQTQQCMCDSLRLKLAKSRQELREVKGEQRLPSKSQGWPNDVRDNEAQTSPKAQLKEITPVPAYVPPQTAPSTCRASALRSCVSDAPTQTDAPILKQTVEAYSQAVSSTSNAEAQTAKRRSDEFGVQAGSGIRTPATVETQTAVLSLSDAASQVLIVAESTEFGVQVAPEPSDSAAQTEAVAAPSATEAEVQATATAAAVSMQTEPPATANASCEANIAPPAKQIAIKLCSVACQSIPPARSVVAVQTTKLARAAVACQAVPPPCIDRATQAQDDRLDVALKREAAHEARIQELEDQLARLTEQNQELTDEHKKAKESAEAFQHMAQSKAFGQMNVTILCPRAECTVSGERVEMDSWNPARLREEFEREVLPRFTRVFVDENSGQKGSKARSEAVDKAMQDFAETFRERLSAMLSAPNAAAAVQAAAAAKSGK